MVMKKSRATAGLPATASPDRPAGRPRLSPPPVREITPEAGIEIRSTPPEEMNLSPLDTVA
jgi:hypothetical protein